jgi:hypothetical protein
VIDSRKSRGTDLFAAVIAGSIASFAALCTISAAKELSSIGTLRWNDLKVAAVFLAVFVPAATVAAVPSYFLLRRMRRLGWLECSCVGLVVGVLVAALLPAKDFASAVVLCFSSLIGAIAAYASLASSASRRGVGA